MSDAGSFFASPQSQQPSQPPSQCNTPMRPAAAAAQRHMVPGSSPGQSPENYRPTAAAAAAAASRGQATAARTDRTSGGGGGLRFDANGTPMPGMLTFTPALNNGFGLSAQQTGGFFATPSVAQQQAQARAQAAAGFSRQATPAAPPAPRFTTTPSMNVPLDFPTPQPSNDKLKQPSQQAAAIAAASAMQFPFYKLGDGGAMTNAGGARVPIPLSMFASGLPSATGGRPLGPAGRLHPSQVRGLQGRGAVSGSSDGHGGPPLPPPIRIARAPLRTLVTSCLARGQLSGAVFYADKLATLEGFSDASVLMLANAYARDRQHQRAIHLLRKNNLLQLPKVHVAEWRAQQQQHEWGQEQRLVASRGPNDEDVSASDPLELRLECLYLGLQSLLEMQAYEEAAACCLPDDEALAALAADEEALGWEQRVDEALAACAPVATVAGLTPQQQADAWAAAAAAVREIIGEQETKLVLTLLKCHALQREKAARIRRKTQQPPQQQQQQPSKQPQSQPFQIAPSRGADMFMTPAVGRDNNNAGIQEQDEPDYDGPIDVCVARHSSAEQMCSTACETPCDVSPCDPAAFVCVCVCVCSCVLPSVSCVVNCTRFSPTSTRRFCGTSCACGSMCGTSTPSKDSAARDSSPHKRNWTCSKTEAATSMAAAATMEARWRHPVH